MSHIYQPVMLKTLLQNGGKASVEQIAKEFLIRDQYQIEYYSQVARKMPGQVLGKKSGSKQPQHLVAMLLKFILDGFDGAFDAYGSHYFSDCRYVWR